MAAILEKLGFEVMKVIDADKRAMLEAIDAFGRKLPQSDIGLLYFAGHGMQINGRNYLIPVQAHVTTETDVELELDGGRYHVEVSGSGHETRSEWIDLSAGEDKRLLIRLEPKQAEAPGKRFTNSPGMEFVWIPAGTFMMGSPSNETGRYNSEAQHRVTLTRGFYMMTTEVTQGQWEAVMGSNPSHFKNCGSNCPVESVSWNDVQEFIRRLNQREGGTRYCLPTEAEWEYAARAGSTTAFANGDITKTDCGYDPNLDGMGWYCGNANKRTQPVGQKRANAWGLYDMHGNVWEWCHDWSGNYPTGEVTDPAGPSSGSSRVLRGGIWRNSAWCCRSAYRAYGTPGDRNGGSGFRLVLPQVL